MQKKQAAPAVHIPSNSATHVSVPVHEETHAPQFAKALSIVAEESGLSSAELTDDTSFGDVGIDSLLGLVVSARFKEELGVDFDFNALFFECPTVGDLKTFFGQLKAGASGLISVPSSSGTTPSSRSSATGMTTPASDKVSLNPRADFQRALQIISEESGVATEDLTDDTIFGDVGVDSLLSLVIVSRLRDELELDVQHEFLFLECPTVGDLRQFMLGESNRSDNSKPPTESKLVPSPDPETTEYLTETSSTPLQAESEDVALATRKKAVDDYVQKYTAGFSVPSPSSSPTATSDNAKVVLVTGASGGLGSHLVDQIAQLPDVKTVVCLNRERNNIDPYLRQQKAMRDKGIRSFDTIRPKLLVLQTDSSKPLLGLSSNDYSTLVSSVTHLIHTAWPMSAKRPLPGFEPQFQTLRNLLDFASHVVAHRPEPFKFTFQLISSIGVVGNYGLDQHNPGNDKNNTPIIVPESPSTVTALLPNGYSAAKWTCELMLDTTLHRHHPSRFRAMAVRLGQIAGCKRSGYWNPMEHFPFVIKSSQTLGVLPDVGVGARVYWTPVNDVAGSLADLVLREEEEEEAEGYPIYHVENPVGQSWQEVNAVLADALGIREMVPFGEWVDRVREAGQGKRGNPAATLVEFLDENYLRMSCGGLVLGVERAVEHSRTLKGVGPVMEEVVRRYVRVWREIGFLD